MTRKKITAAMGIAIILIIAYQSLTRSKKNKDYIFDNKSNIKLNDITNSLKKVDYDKENSKEIFSDNVVNHHTLKFFKFLQKKFKDMNFNEHLIAINEYLLTIMPEDEAEKLFAIYKLFVEYELNISQKINNWGNPENTEDALDVLHQMHEYRRKFFGKELADALFGAETKAKEYPLRRNSILRDDSLYASNKEEKLKKLNKDMWGDEAETLETIPEPYTRYKEKIQLYEKDMSEMSDNEKNTKIREIREDIFTPEVIERLEGVDRQLARSKQNEKNYYAGEEKIENDPDLSDEEKKQKINELQKLVFGKGADAFRRRENIRKANLNNQ